MWENFRAKVQHVMLHPKAAENYVGVLQEISEDFIEHLAKNLDENRETRGNFLHELFKWALECISNINFLNIIILTFFLKASVKYPWMFVWDAW